jgi:hypothetical protein
LTVLCGQPDEYTWKIDRLDMKRVGGTIAVHFIKKNMWYEKYERHLEMEMK